MNINVIKAELRELEVGKIADYESYKSGEISREKFIERKHKLDAKRNELQSILSEIQAQEQVCDMSEGEYGDAMEIKKYLHLESFDKAVMASLISCAKVMGRNAWK